MKKIDVSRLDILPAMLQKNIHGSLQTVTETVKIYEYKSTLTPPIGANISIEYIAVP
jgi:hypothetical protein